MDKQSTEYDVASDILSLASKDLSKCIWDTWTENERESAVDWASAVYLAASDNVIRKKRLITPKHVAILPDLIGDYSV